MRIKLFILCIACSGLVQASPTAIEWLKRMHYAVHQLDYEGRFLYQVGKHVESMYVVHRMDAGHELERLVALQGDERQVIRSDSAVALLEPGGFPINITKPQGRIAKQLANSPINYHKLAQRYAISLGGQYRVAGRDTQIVSLLPKDKLRFGHHLYLDKETALPLRSIMLDEQGGQRMQVSFVDIKVGENITPIEQDISALSLAKPIGTKMAEAKKRLWNMRKLPTGFALDMYHYYPAEQREHLIFSDGLASISMYIEKQQEKVLDGHSSMGTVQVYGCVKHGQQVTLVGEVPSMTLELFADALKPNHD